MRSAASCIEKEYWTQLSLPLFGVGTRDLEEEEDDDDDIVVVGSVIKALAVVDDDLLLCPFLCIFDRCRGRRKKKKERI